MEKFHYRACGLDNIYLVNGVTVREREDGGKTFHIKNMDGLHEAIARYLAGEKPHLSGKELRFLRQQLGLAQAHLAACLKVDVQTVARAEKRARVSGPIEAVVRQLYLEHVNGNAKLGELLKEIADLDDALDDEESSILFEEGRGGWEHTKQAA